MGAVGNASRGIHAQVVAMVAHYLSDSGLQVTPRPYKAAQNMRLSEALAAMDDDLGGDLRGLADAFAVVSSRGDRYRLAEDIARARVGADVAGKQTAIVVQWRGGKPVSEAFAVLSLADLARLLGGTPPP
ncbi:hypothetical protein NS183_02905 [Microbacterium testaceum]|uniref:hypothetical protein n=1 Tax=Microbacterium testaceum TaxID=2033 RepID=UPI0007340C15|nr:hypothetical protein [Microbacterium testaceum]KTS91724.1 hypothetical protein NS183_02905 [Microbacterium testaceum]